MNDTDIFNLAQMGHSVNETGLQPLFLVLALQAIHSPLEAPEDWVSKYNWIKNKDRRTLVCVHHLLTYKYQNIENCLANLQHELLQDILLASCLNA